MSDPSSPRAPTSATRAANATLSQELPFDDTTAFDLAHRGFLAPLPSAQVRGEAGNVVWDPQRFAFINDSGSDADTVNPSLWRQAQLLNESGLFKVIDGVYQVGEELWTMLASRSEVQSGGAGSLPGRPNSRR